MPAPPAFVRLAAHPLRWQLLTELAGSDQRVRELSTRLDQPQNVVSYHLRLLREGALVTATRSSHDGRDSYYRLDLDRCAEALSSTGTALHPALRRGPAPPTGDPAPPVAVLFVCTGNSARSPVAEALLAHHTAGQVTVASAGSRPKPKLHPDAVRVLREAFGIDIAGRHPQHLDAVADRHFDYVITLCDKAREVCSDFGHPARQLHWSTPDPAMADDDDVTAFERMAQDIDTRIRYLLSALVSETKEVQP